MEEFAFQNTTRRPAYTSFNAKIQLGRGMQEHLSTMSMSLAWRLLNTATINLAIPNGGDIIHHLSQDDLLHSHIQGNRAFLVITRLKCSRARSPWAYVSSIRPWKPFSPRPLLYHFCHAVHWYLTTYISKTIDCPLTGANFWTGFDFNNETDPGGSPLCDPAIQRNFTITPRNSGSTKVRLELASVRTRGRLILLLCFIMLRRLPVLFWSIHVQSSFFAYIHNPPRNTKSDAGTGCAATSAPLSVLEDVPRCTPLNFQTNRPFIEGDNTLACSRTITAYYYAQPSMGVVVCPATFDENNTRQVAEDCYYIYKWVGSWRREPEKFSFSKYVKRIHHSTMGMS